MFASPSDKLPLTYVLELHPLTLRLLSGATKERPGTPSLPLAENHRTKNRGRVSSDRSEWVLPRPYLLLVGRRLCKKAPVAPLCFSYSCYLCACSSHILPPRSTRWLWSALSWPPKQRIEWFSMRKDAFSAPLSHLLFVQLAPCHLSSVCSSAFILIVSVCPVYPPVCLYVRLCNVRNSDVHLCRPLSVSVCLAGSTKSALSTQLAVAMQVSSKVLRTYTGS